MFMLENLTTEALMFFEYLQMDVKEAIHRKKEKVTLGVPLEPYDGPRPGP
jgi:hypothetical protein